MSSIDDSSDLDVLVRGIFNTTADKANLSLKDVKQQLADKIGRVLSKPEASQVKVLVIELYQNYAAAASDTADDDAGDNQNVNLIS